MGMANGVLIVRWSLGGVSVDSGFRSDDSAAQDRLHRRRLALIAKRQDGGRPADSPSTNGAPS